MALTKITYTDKVSLEDQPSVAEVNKVTDANMNEIKTLDKRMFFNVINLGSLYFITADKTYRAKYLISPKYLAITLNIYVATAKEEKNGTN